MSYVQYYQTYLLTILGSLANGNRANMSTIVNLFQSTDKHVNRNLSTFIRKAFEINKKSVLFVLC